MENKDREEQSVFEHAIMAHMFSGVWYGRGTLEIKILIIDSWHDPFIPLLGKWKRGYKF